MIKEARNIFLCYLLGHLPASQEAPVKGECQSCGRRILSTRDFFRIRHVVACFFGGHRYQSVGMRNDYSEYVCLRCGHPLLLKGSKETSLSFFKKRVRYLCNFLGHRVNKVIERQGMTEYACSCGHTFLKKETALAEVKHPPLCFFVGHFVKFVEKRFGLEEFLCRHCGHTFCFEGAK